MQPTSAASGFNIIAFCPFLGDTIATVSAAPAACVITPPLRSGDTIIRCLRRQRYTVPSGRSPYIPHSNFFPVQLPFDCRLTTVHKPPFLLPILSQKPYHLYLFYDILTIFLRYSYDILTIFLRYHNEWVMYLSW